MLVGCYQKCIWTFLLEGRMQGKLCRQLRPELRNFLMGVAKKGKLCRQLRAELRTFLRKGQNRVAQTLCCWRNIMIFFSISEHFDIICKFLIQMMVNILDQMIINYMNHTAGLLEYYYDWGAVIRNRKWIWKNVNKMTSLFRYLLPVAQHDKPSAINRDPGHFKYN